MRLKDKIAIVTGSSMGIGEAIATRFAKEGATVAVNYFKSPEAAENVVKDIESRGGTAKAYKADVSKISEIEKLASDLRTTL